MALILYKWLLVFLLGTGDHPIYVSVSEVEFNENTKTIDISCKIFTDDFEQTLRLNNPGKINLQDASRKTAMVPLVKNYIQSHFKIEVNGKTVPLEFIDFEPDEDGIVSFMQGRFQGVPQSVKIYNEILYDYKSEQMGIMHVFVKGKRQSTKLVNPQNVAELKF